MHQNTEAKTVRISRGLMQIHRSTHQNSIQQVHSGPI